MNPIQLAVDDAFLERDVNSEVDETVAELGRPKQTGHALVALLVGVRDDGTAALRRSYRLTVVEPSDMLSFVVSIRHNQAVDRKVVMAAT